MAYSVKCLPNKPKELSLDSSMHRKGQVRLHESVTPAWRGRKRERWQDCCQSIYQWHPGSMKKLILDNKVRSERRGHLMLIIGLCTHKPGTHMHTTHTH